MALPSRPRHRDLHSSCRSGDYRAVPLDRTHGMSAACRWRAMARSGMPAFTLAQAIAATGRSRSTLIRAIRQGTITATRDKSGTYLVEPSELHRVFPAADHGMPDDLPNGVPRHAELAARFEAEQAKNAI